MKYNACGGNETRVASFVAAACLLICTTSPFASRADAISEERAGELAPGSYIWNPSLATDGPLSMRVDLASQTAYVYRDDTLIGVTTIASGKRGYETPDGTFSVLEKERIHHSNKYDNAPMPYMQRLTWSGLALHGGHPRGYPASHGCIRMPMGFAAALFKEDTRGMKVAITGHARGRALPMMANRQRARTPVQEDGWQTTEFSGGQNAWNGPSPEQCCAPAPAGAPASSVRTDDDEGADQSGYGPEDSYPYYNPDRRDPRYDGYYRPAREREHSRDVSPENLSPPPN